MERRLSAVETEIGALKNAMGTLSTEVGAISSDLKTLAGAFDRFATRVEATKPPGVTTVLSSIAATTAIIGAGYALFFFLVNAQVGVATQRANQFVETWERNGRLYLLEQNVKNFYMQERKKDDYKK
jgi:hypothetical protein